MKKVLLLVVLVSCSFIINAQFKITPHAHSHNDYLKTEPLWGALNNGCQSIEVDVFAYNNKLVVSHIGFGLIYKPSFEDLYLDTLINYLQNHNTIFTNSTEPLILMIDFKTASTPTIDLLLKSIAPYKAYFSYFENGQVIEKQIKLVISGAGFSYNHVKDMPQCYVFLDGGVQHCEKDFPQGLVPRGSASYGSYFKWNGSYEMPIEEKQMLEQMVSEATTCNKKLRFYAMPAKKNIWHTFIDAGVYWINIDDSDKFKSFYNKEYKKRD